MVKCIVSRLIMVSATAQRLMSRAGVKTGARAHKGAGCHFAERTGGPVSLTRDSIPVRTFIYEPNADEEASPILSYRDAAHSLSATLAAIYAIGSEAEAVITGAFARPIFPAIPDCRDEFVRKR